MPSTYADVPEQNIADMPQISAELLPYTSCYYIPDVAAIYPKYLILAAIYPKYLILAAIYLSVAAVCLRHLATLRENTTTTRNYQRGRIC